MRNSRRAGKPAGRKPEKQGLTGLFTKGKNIPTTAQQTLPYREMYRDGVCRVADRYYTKTIEYEDINYQLAQSEDQAAIFDGWSACLNYFDSSLPFQLSFLNHRSRPGSRYSVNIPMQDDDYNSVRCEYVEMQDLVNSQVSMNFLRGIATWCYFDEFHVLLRDRLTASYCVAIWKMLRKKGCVPSALTQNVKDFLASPEIENIFENSDFLVLLSQAQGDRQILAKQLGISPHQLSYVTHTNSGEGLLFFGNTTIPFVDRFPQNTELYAIMTTRPEDKKQEMNRA